MEYPLIDRQLLADLRLVHAFYNTCVALLFFYHGSLGLAIRRARKAGAMLPLAAVRRHRKMGPVLIVLGVLGFFLGLSLVMLRTGNVFEYPPHLFVGLAIVVSLVSTRAVSRKIKGPDSPYRKPHFIFGCAILCLYVIEVFLGIAVLL